MNLVEKIQQLADMKSVKISAIERELDFGRSSIYKWNKNSPSIDKLIKVADYFGVSLDYLTERYIYRENLKTEPEGEYTVITKKAKEKGISPETMAKLIDLWGK